MKKRILLVLAVLTMLLCVPLITNAASVDDLTFDAATGTITECNRDAEGELVIPSEIDGVEVTGIGSFAFSGCKSLTNINIPNSVTIISHRAFYECESLKILTIPDSVTSIGYNAFFNCTSLTSVNIPDSVTNIGNRVFTRCGSLKINVSPNNQNYCDIDGVLFDKNKKTIVAYAKDKIQPNYAIPDGITNIGYEAFFDCDSLTDVILPDGATSIGNEAFRDCNKLTSVNIPDSMTSIGNGVFGECESLQNINIPDGVTSIGNETFMGCTSLTSVKLSNSVTKISDEMFYGCKNLTSVNIPDSIVSIGWGAFLNCASLTSVTLPDVVTNIGDFAFYNCASLTNVNIPDSMTSINLSAFYGCKSLTYVLIPNSVTSIGYEAFSGCESMTDVYYSGSKTEWEKIDIDDRRNDPLLHATIHYGKYDPITPAALTVTPSGGGYVLTADTSYVGIAYAAAYDAEGALISVVSKPFADGTATVAPDIAGAAKIKFFVWTNKLQPVTLVKEITLN